MVVGFQLVFVRFRPSPLAWTGNNLMTIPKPTWPPGIRAIWTGPRCTAMSKQARRRCKQASVKGRTVCYWHGGRAGAPLDNMNSVSSGDYMREDYMAARANAAI